MTDSRQAETRAATQAPGRMVGPWRLLERLGEGGMGVVYRAEGPRGISALKLLQATDVERLLRFRREAEAVARVGGHPNVAQIHGAELEGPEPWIAFEYAGSGTLEDRIGEDRPWSEESLVELAEALAGALAHLHDAGILHRDLKPSNILYEGDVPLVADFGLARVEDGQTLTKTGASLGTPATMAPEQFDGRPLTAAVDTRAIGLLLWWAAVGRRPFEADSMEGWYRQIALQSPPSLARERPDLDRDLVALVMRCLAIKPEQRPPDGTALVAELDALRRLEPSRRRRRRTFALLAASIALTALIVGLVSVRLPQRLAKAQAAEARAAKRTQLDARLAALAEQAHGVREELAEAVRVRIVTGTREANFSGRVKRWRDQKRVVLEHLGSHGGLQAALRRMRSARDREAFVTCELASRILSRAGAIDEGFLAELTSEGEQDGSKASVSPARATVWTRALRPIAEAFEMRQLHEQGRSAALIKSLQRAPPSFTGRPAIKTLLREARSRLLLAEWSSRQPSLSEDGRAGLGALMKEEPAHSSAALAAALRSAPESTRAAVVEVLLPASERNGTLLEREWTRSPGRVGYPFFPPATRIDPFTAEVLQEAVREGLAELSKVEDAEQRESALGDLVVLEFRRMAALPRGAKAARSERRWPRSVLRVAAGELLLSLVRLQRRRLEVIGGLRLGAARCDIVFAAPSPSQILEGLRGGNSGSLWADAHPADARLLRMWAGAVTDLGGRRGRFHDQAVAAAREVLMSSDEGELIRAEAAHRLAGIDYHTRRLRYAYNKILQAASSSADARKKARDSLEKTPMPVVFQQAELEEMVRLSRRVNDANREPAYPQPDQLPLYLARCLASARWDPDPAETERTAQLDDATLLELVDLALKGNALRGSKDDDALGSRFHIYESRKLRTFELAKIQSLGARILRQLERHEEARARLETIRPLDKKPVIYWRERLQYAREDGDEAALLAESRRAIEDGHSSLDESMEELIEQIEADVAARKAKSSSAEDSKR